MNIYKKMMAAKEDGQKMLAVLIDPEKIEIEAIQRFVKLIHSSIATHILVGGSTDKNNLTEQAVIAIKKYTVLPVILFPGDVSQVTPAADGILFLSLISGENPEYLIRQQIAAVPKLKNSDLEVIPTGYLLVDGGIETSVQRTSNTLPVSQQEKDQILNMALASEYLGKKLLYIEAGSGAKTPVATSIIKNVSNQLNIPLIVGGGIRTKEQLDQAYEAGADMVVIGTAFETNPTFFKELQKETIHENIG
jgi:putative glycerol-1-phosphate prenyltransferase